MSSFYAIMVFLLGFTLNGNAGPMNQVMVALAFPEGRTLQLETGTRQRPMETAQRDRPIEDEREEARQPEKKETESEAATPKPSIEPKEGPPRDFVPTEKIPADQAVDFPTDI